MTDAQQMRPTRLLAILFVLSFLATGAIDAMLGHADAIQTPTLLPHAFFIAFLSFAWSRYDARERNLEPPAYTALFCGLAPILGVPYHLFRTRPPRHASVSVAKGIGLLIAALLAYELGILLTG